MNGMLIFWKPFKVILSPQNESEGEQTTAAACTCREVQYKCECAASYTVMCYLFKWLYNYRDCAPHAPEPEAGIQCVITRPGWEIGKYKLVYLCRILVPFCFCPFLQDHGSIIRIRYRIGNMAELWFFFPPSGRLGYDSQKLYTAMRAQHKKKCL